MVQKSSGIKRLRGIAGDMVENPLDRCSCGGAMFSKCLSKGEGVKHRAAFFSSSSGRNGSSALRALDKLKPSARTELAQIAMDRIPRVNVFIAGRRGALITLTLSGVTFSAGGNCVARVWVKLRCWRVK
jgi:hypothetical protein